MGMPAGNSPMTQRAQPQQQAPGQGMQGLMQAVMQMRAQHGLGGKGPAQRQRPQMPMPQMMQGPARQPFVPVQQMPQRTFQRPPAALPPGMGQGLFAPGQQQPFNSQAYADAVFEMQHEGKGA